MKSSIARAAALGAAFAFAFGCGGDEQDPDPSRSLAAASERAAAAAAAAPQGTAGNRAPAIERVTFAPEHPISEGPLEANVVARDPDGDLVQFEYEWRMNGQTLQSGAGASIRLPKLVRGDKVEVFVTASDGTLNSDPFRASARFENRAPTITFLYITPQNKRIRRGDVLTAVPEAQDPDGDHLEYEYVWTANGETVGEERQFDTKSLRRGDKVSVTVVANDGFLDSPERALEPIELVNSAPVITQLPQLEHQGSRLAYQFEAEDAEGDRNLRFFLGKAPDGMEIDAFSGLLTWEPAPDQTGKHTVEVGVKDSEGDASKFEWEVTVNAVAPPASARD